MKLKECTDLSLYILSGVVTTFMFIGLMIPQAHAQTMSPLTEDQDGDGDLLNEENDIKVDCAFDYTSGFTEAFEGAFGENFEAAPPTLSEDDCNFVMHYLSGQCEEQSASGANVTQVCNATLRDYLSAQGLYTKDFPTDTERFNAVLDEFRQNEALEKQEAASKEANKPSWTENLK